MATPDDTFILYAADHDKSESLTINIVNSTIKDFHSITGTKLQDSATLVRHKLKKGRVVTLYEATTTAILPDLSRARRVYDIIGDGKEHTIDLRDVNMNDCVSGWAWRNINVDHPQGYVVLYEATRFSGARTTIFPEEWEFNKEKGYNINEWHSHDRVSSIKWHNMIDTVIMKIYEATNKGGKSSSIARGSGEISDLNSVGMNDRMSSFDFTRVKPVKEELHDVTSDDVVPVGEVPVTLKAQGALNAGNEPGTYTAKYTSQITETTSLTVTDTHTAGGAIQYGYSWNVVGNGASLSMEFHYNYTNEESSTHSLERVKSLSVNESYTIPAQSSWSYEWVALWKRTEKIPAIFEGVLHMRTVSKFTSTPLSPDSAPLRRHDRCG